MQTRPPAVALLSMTFAAAAGAVDGLVSMKSAHCAKASMGRLEEAVRQRGLNVFARIEHAAGQVWVGDNDPAYLAKRHDVASCPAVEKLREALAGLAEAAAGK
jgi:hypothetical protein